MHLHKSMCDTVYLKYLFEMGSKRVLFLSIFENTLDIGEVNVHYFIEFMLCVTYINSVTQGAFHSTD